MANLACTFVSHILPPGLLGHLYSSEVQPPVAEKKGNWPQEGEDDALNPPGWIRHSYVIRKLIHLQGNLPDARQAIFSGLADSCQPEVEFVKAHGGGKRRSELKDDSHLILSSVPKRMSLSSWDNNGLPRFLHTLGEARSIALVEVTDRSTERKLFLEKDDLKT